MKRNSKISLSQKRQKITNIDYFEEVLEESGLKLKEPPNKCVASQKTKVIICNLKKILQQSSDFPNNVNTFHSNFEKRCNDSNVFKHYLSPNIVQADTLEPCTSDSVIKILLSVSVCQNNITKYLFKKACSQSGQFKPMILKCFSTLDYITDTSSIAENLVNLLAFIDDKMVRIDIVTAIPKIIRCEAPDCITTELGRILSEDHDLIPAILDCLSLLCLSSEQYDRFQKETLSILKTLKCTYFPNFIKFLLTPEKTLDENYLQIVTEIRSSLGWSTTTTNDSTLDIASSQILTASAIETSIVSSKVIGDAWLKVISNCQLSADHLPIDFIILLLLYSTTEEREKQIETVIKKQVKLDILNDEILDDAFTKFEPILKDNFKKLVTLAKSLLKCQGEPLIQQFASHIYTLMFFKLGDYRQTTTAELLRLGVESKQSLNSILAIFNTVAQQDMSILKPLSLKMLTLLYRMDEMTLSEVRAVMDLLCGLSFTYENSVIKDEMCMFIHKELGSSDPIAKVRGILAGIHAIKYLMRSNQNQELIVNLKAKELQEEAVEIIDSITMSIKQYPDMITLFYDEFSKIVELEDKITEQFLECMTQNVTDNLENFFVDTIEEDSIKGIKLKMQYSINEQNEVDKMFAINIAGLVLQDNPSVSIGILCSLFHLVQALHMRSNNGDLKSIDALLGCPVIMPIFDMDLIENMTSTEISLVLDCQVYCANWFRELLNAFASQNDKFLRLKLYKRILDLKRVHSIIEEILIKTNISYTPPSCTFRLNNINLDTKQIKSRNKAQTHDDSLLPQTFKTQGSSTNIFKKNKLNTIHQIQFRPLSLELLKVLEGKLGQRSECDMNLTIEILTFLLSYINLELENILISKIKRVTFLSKKEEDVEPYNRKKAEECAKEINKILPKIMEHLKFITATLDVELAREDGDVDEHSYNDEVLKCIEVLEKMFKMCTIYFKWIGFKSQQKPLLKSSLRTVVNIVSEKTKYNMQYLILSVAKFLQDHEKYCIQVSVAVALLEYLKAIQEYSTSPAIVKILREMAKKFLSRQWKTTDGIVEKGLLLNHSLNTFAREYFMHNEISDLKNITLIIMNDVKKCADNPKSYLESFQSVNMLNFPVLYKNLGHALQITTRTQVNKGLTNSEHLELWNDVNIILKHMTDMAKLFDSRNNLTAFFKYSFPIMKLFVSHGLPILKIEFKMKTQEITQLIKTLQENTKFLQSLCHHSKLKNDAVLIGKVPYVKQILETIVYKVKAVLTANNCSAAFWMGNLKHKNIHGEIIQSQEVEETVELEDCDEHLCDVDDEQRSAVV